MAKGDQEKMNAEVTKSRVNQGQLYDQYLNSVREQGKGLGDQANKERSQLWDTGTGYSATGGMTDEAAQRLRDSGRFGPVNPSSGGGSSGGSLQANNSGNPYAMNGGNSAFNYVGPSAFNDVNWDFNDSKGVYKGLSGETGGFNEARLGAIDKNAAELGNINADRYANVQDTISNLTRFGATGGLSQSDYDELNRPIFQEFERTGGYSDPQLADIRARSNASIPSFYNNLQDEMSRRRAQTGGYGSGFDAASAKMARQSAQQGAEQSRNTEIGLADTVRTGRMDAAKQLAANRMGLIQYTTPAKEAALAAAGNEANQLAGNINTGLNYGGNLNLNTQDLINRTRLAAAGGLHGIELDDAQLKMLKAKGIDDYTINVATGKDRYATAEDQIAAQERIAMAGIGASSGSARYGIDSQMAMQQAMLNSQNERYIMGSKQQGQEFGMSNLLDLYRSANGPLGQNNAAWLGGLNGYSSSQNQNLAIQAGMANQPGSQKQGWSNMFQGIGALAPLLGGFGGGGGSNMYDPNNPWAQYMDTGYGGLGFGGTQGGNPTKESFNPSAPGTMNYRSPAMNFDYWT